uniref:Uncharacterized protein n=1 Tax=Fagus sylvatica TaxID=28930 RepID=A0A2N9I7G6_FAGSY
MSLSYAAASFTLASSAISQLNGTSDGRYWMKPNHVEPKMSELRAPLAARFAAPVVVEKVDESTKDYDRAKVAKELGMVKDDHRLEKFRDDATVAFSGAEGLFLVFSLDRMRMKGCDGERKRIESKECGLYNAMDGSFDVFC